MQPNIHPLGDQGLLLDWGNRLDEVVHQQVQAIWRSIEALQLPGVLDLVPAYSSLAILWDTPFLLEHYPGRLPFEWVKTWIEPILPMQQTSQVQPGREVVVPVCFEEPYALDLAALSQQKQLSPAQFIEQFCAQPYRVYLLGFLPGFAYMGTVSPALAAPRRAVPRALIPAGSVGIAGAQTGIYPLDSPGGWQIIGRSPWRMFTPEADPPVRLQVADQVRFYPVNAATFLAMQQAEAAEQRIDKG